MDVLYDYDCQGISKIFKLKDPIAMTISANVSVKLMI